MQAECWEQETVEHVMDLVVVVQIPLLDHPSEDSLQRSVIPGDNPPKDLEYTVDS